MTTRVNPNPFKAPLSSSPEKAKASSSFGWMDTALLVSGTLICGGVFSPACGLVYALVYMGGKLAEESPNPTPKPCVPIPPQPIKQVISLIEEADVVIQKTDAAASLIKPASPKAAPSKLDPKEAPVPSKISLLIQENAMIPSVAPNLQELPSSQLSVVEPEPKEVENKNPPPPLVETIKSSLSDLPTLQKELPVFNFPEPMEGAKENLFASLMETPTVAIPIQDKLSLATQALTASVERTPAPAIPKKSLRDASPKTLQANPSQIPLPESLLTNAKRASLSSKPMSFPPAIVPVAIPALSGKKAITSSQRLHPQKSSWFQSLFGGKKVPGRPPGIPNQGNTCFAASVFHFIADNPVFSNHLVELMPDASKKFFQKWLPIYQKEKAEGIAHSSIPIREMRRLLFGSGGQILGFNQEDAHDLLMGILGSILIQLNSDPTISLETHQEAHKALLKNPLLRIKTERKTFYVGKETSLEGTNLVRYPANPEHAYSLKRTIEIPVLDVQFMRDEKGIVSFPLPLMLEQNWFYDRASDSDEPYKLKNNCLALPIHTEISFDKPPEVLIVTLARFHGAQKIQTSVDVPLTMTLPLNGTAKREEAEYELKGTVIHSGTTLRGGHYISEGISVDPIGNQQIWSASDRQVQSINSATFADHAAHSYMQIYTKKAKPA